MFPGKLPPIPKKLSLLDANRFPELRKLTRKEQALSFLPNGHPSPLHASWKDPFALPNHFNFDQVLTLK